MQDEEQRAQLGVISAEVEDEHEYNAVGAVVEAEHGEDQEAEEEEPPLSALYAGHGQEAEEQGEVDVHVHPLRLIVVGVGG